MGIPFSPGDQLRWIPWTHQIHIGDRITQPWVGWVVNWQHLIQVHHYQPLTGQFCGKCRGRSGMGQRECGHMGWKALLPSQYYNDLSTEIIFRIPVVAPIGTPVTAYMGALVPMGMYGQITTLWNGGADQLKFPADQLKLHGCVHFTKEACVCGFKISKKWCFEPIRNNSRPIVAAGRPRMSYCRLWMVERGWNTHPWRGPHKGISSQIFLDISGDPPLVPPQFLPASKVVRHCNYRTYPVNRVQPPQL